MSTLAKIGINVLIWFAFMVLGVYLLETLAIYGGF